MFHHPCMARVLGAKADDLSKALTTRIVAARGEIYETKLVGMNEL